MYVPVRSPASPSSGASAKSIAFDNPNAAAAAAAKAPVTLDANPSKIPAAFVFEAWGISLLARVTGGMVVKPGIVSPAPPDTFGTSVDTIIDVISDAGGFDGLLDRV